MQLGLVSDCVGWLQVEKQMGCVGNLPCGCPPSVSVVFFYQHTSAPTAHLQVKQQQLLPGSQGMLLLWAISLTDPLPARDAFIKLCHNAGKICVAGKYYRTWFPYVSPKEEILQCVENMIRNKCWLVAGKSGHRGKIILAVAESFPL